tara:strand:+ start:148 stop:1254 length:1107 start_codon:yes stop_codon:yes gene_type:complete
MYTYIQQISNKITIKKEEEMADVEGKTKEMDEEEVDADGWPKSLQHRKDGSCRSWLAVLGAALAQFVAVGSFYTIGMFVVPFMNAFDCGRGLAAATGSFSAIGFLTWSPFAGRFGDRYGSRRAILIGGSTATFFYFLASFSESIYAIWILYGIGVGFGCSTMYAPSAAIPANWFVKKRGLATGLAVAGGALGNVIFPLILSPILTSFGWAWALRIMGILTLVSCILSYFLIERRFPLITDGSPVIKLDLGLLKKRPGLLRLALTYGAFQFGFFAPLLHLPAYTELDAGGTGLGLPASATVLSFMGLGNFIGRFALGVLADKAGPIATGTFANVMVAIATFFWPMYNDLAILSAYGFFYGLFGSAFWSL